MNRSPPDTTWGSFTIMKYFVQGNKKVRGKVKMQTGKEDGGILFSSKQ